MAEPSSLQSDLRRLAEIVETMGKLTERLIEIREERDREQARSARSGGE